MPLIFCHCSLCFIAQYMVINIAQKTSTARDRLYSNLIDIILFVHMDYKTLFRSTWACRRSVQIGKSLLCEQALGRCLLNGKFLWDKKTFERCDVTACFSQARSNAVFQLCGNGECISPSSTHCICCVQRAKWRSRQQNPLGFCRNSSWLFCADEIPKFCYKQARGMESSFFSFLALKNACPQDDSP